MKVSVYGRTVALCRADGRDLGADMVVDGHAWAFVRDSRDYVDEEREAAAVRAGIHGHTCEPAWLWRSERRKNRRAAVCLPAVRREGDQDSSARQGERLAPCE